MIFLENVTKIRNAILLSFFFICMIIFSSVILNNEKLSEIEKLSSYQNTIQLPETYNLLLLQSKTHYLSTLFSNSTHNHKPLSNQTDIINNQIIIIIENLQKNYKKNHNDIMIAKLQEYNDYYDKYFLLGHKSNSLNELQDNAQNLPALLTEAEAELDEALDSFITSNKEVSASNLTTIQNNITDLNTQVRALYALLLGALGICFFFIDRISRHI